MAFRGVPGYDDEDLMQVAKFAVLRWAAKYDVDRVASGSPYQYILIGIHRDLMEECRKVAATVGNNRYRIQRGLPLYVTHGLSEAISDDLHDPWADEEGKRSFGELAVNELLTVLHTVLDDGDCIVLKLISEHPKMTYREIKSVTGYTSQQIKDSKERIRKAAEELGAESYLR